MKEDYLWDKSGDDAEIKGLENALAAFRYQETAPPVLPQKVFALEKPKARGFFRFAFPAFAGFAALVVILSVAWFQLSETGKSSAIAETVSETNELKRAEKTDGDSFIAPREVENAPVEPSGTVKRFEERKSADPAPKVVKIRRKITLVVRRETVAHTKKFVEPAETLTKEEQYAYDQLMLALTITGSKLKIVQDKINNIDGQSAIVEK